MERPLNMNDGWEQIINDEGRQQRIDAFHARRYQSKVDKLNAIACICGAMAVVLAVLGLTGALTTWIAFPVCAVLAGVSCFNFGRVYELTK